MREGGSLVQRNKRGSIRAALAFLLAAGATASAEEAKPIERLAWLAGCWEMRTESATIEEQWMRLSGGTLLGMNRTVSAGRTEEFEFLRVEDRGGKLVYVALPSGRNESAFEAVEIGDSTILFENPKHDFPKRIRYRLLADGSLVARIEGETGGNLRAVDFPMKRVPCVESGDRKTE